MIEDDFWKVLVTENLQFIPVAASPQSDDFAKKICKGEGWTVFMLDS